jgi:trans-aconitate methyltransferase
LLESRAYHPKMRHADASAMFDGARFDTPAPSTWADLGCGDGTFTRALAERLAQGSTIHAVDRNRGAVTRTAGFPRVQKLGSRRSRYQRAALYAALCER